MHETVQLRIVETVRAPSQERVTRTVLLIEGDEVASKKLAVAIGVGGFQVVVAADSAAAIEQVMGRRFDAVICELDLPGASGVDVLNVVRAYDPDVPLVLVTDKPTMATAIEACSLGVLEYLVKPSIGELMRVLERAGEARRATIARRETQPELRVEPGRASTGRPGPRSCASLSASPSVKASFERALASLTVDLDPIVDVRSRSLMGFAARIASKEEALKSEAALVMAADRLGRLPALRRRARDLAVKAFADAPEGTSLFVDVHPSDLLDGDLYSPDPATAKVADRLVLQVRARGAALSIEDLSARVSVLRFVGYRLAIADLDVDQACLSQIAELSPEFVKIDAPLVRKVHLSPSRKRMVTALVSMCHALDALLVAEGVSSAEERDALVSVGCDLVHGPLVAHVAPNSIRRPVVASIR